MPATPNFIHGFKGTCTVGGSTFYVKQFQFSMKNTVADVTHSGATTTYNAAPVSYRVKIAGITEVSGSLTFTFDSANQPTVTPYIMTPGATVALVLSPDGTKNYSFSAITTGYDFRSGAGVNSDVECSITFESTGVITVPSS